MKWEPERNGYDEAFDAGGTPRRHYQALIAALESFTQTEVDRRERLQKLSLIDQGVTFTVYGEKEGVERIFPFDFVPRIIPPAEWKKLEAGLVQRVTALNLFIADVYGEQKCLKDNVVPADLILSRTEYKRELLGVHPPRGIYTHVVGTDIIRDDRGEYRAYMLPPGRYYIRATPDLSFRGETSELGSQNNRPHPFPFRVRLNLMGLSLLRMSSPEITGSMSSRSARTIT